jgi:hypothetical protein
MKTKWILLSLAFPLVSFSQPDWRFGFEDTWAMVTGFMTDAQKGTLLSRMARLVESQKAPCDVNFPAVNGGWKGMQPMEGGKIDFSASDRAVRLLQKHGFSMLWNLRINTAWSSAGNPSCYGTGDCAPDSAHEQDLFDFIASLVERYDGDGYLDMGYETPNDFSDDLIIPVRRYLMTGEIEFLGPSPPPSDGKYGDEATQHFWTDNIENLIRTHRIIYRAIRHADPTGNTKLISSGGVFWDLYKDFPDWPDIEGPTVASRLAGNNNHGVSYRESFNRLKQMLAAFGDDSEGRACDYIGWHPHMPWREIEQTFGFIRTYAGAKPIYIDDMWCNIFPIDSPDAPGNTLFTGGGLAIEGDFPNDRIPSYTALKQGLNFNNPEIVDWYYARHARTLVKAFVSAFGEGAERVSISGIADFLGDKLNLMTTMADGFRRKPGYYTYKLMADLFHDFSRVDEIAVSNDPRTRLYRFERPRGVIYAGWSETGGPPENLDYSRPNGETIGINWKSDRAVVTQLISDTLQPEAKRDTLVVPAGRLEMQLGFSPVFVEPYTPSRVGRDGSNGAPRSAILYQNVPNPFNPATVIRFEINKETHVRILIFDLAGRMIRSLVDETRYPGQHRILFDASGLASGIYFYQITAGNFSAVRKMVKID